jgi:hypothetical protein
LRQRSAALISTINATGHMNTAHENKNPVFGQATCNEPLTHEVLTPQRQAFTVFTRSMNQIN